MIGRGWRCRTAAFTGLLFIPGWLAMWTMVWWYWHANSQLICQSALAATSTVWRSCHQRHRFQPSVPSGGPAIQDNSAANWRVGKGNENLVYPSPWDLKRSVTCHKMLRHGISGFTSHPKEGVDASNCFWYHILDISSTTMLKESFHYHPYHLHPLSLLQHQNFFQ
jgi:hypothetical protein